MAAASAQPLDVLDPTLALSIQALTLDPISGSLASSEEGADARGLAGGSGAPGGSKAEPSLDRSTFPGSGPLAGPMALLEASGVSDGQPLGSWTSAAAPSLDRLTSTALPLLPLGRQSAPWLGPLPAALPSPAPAQPPASGPMPSAAEADEPMVVGMGAGVTEGAEPSGSGVMPPPASMRTQLLDQLTCPLSKVG